VAKIEDLMRQVSDERLRNELASEVRELKKQKRFGLVFEEHLPEMLRLPKVPIRVGNVVGRAMDRVRTFGEYSKSRGRRRSVGSL
jgi:adenine-specific DNA-methyltransferase